MLLALAAVSGASAADTERWQRHTALPEPRTEVAAALAGDRIVVAGGFVDNGGNSPRADAYSVPDGRWSRLPDLPQAVDHAAAAGLGGRAYILGGYGSDRRPLRTAFVLEGRSWRELAQLPEARAAAAAAISGG
ncbi:MAG: kelch motif-containing protein, partial [Actinomycetota bacterium]|nr:kelch motif-containing protein [Actinomycetota bacterium]